jgi:tRNA/rRNA methyltransferase
VLVLVEPQDPINLGSVVRVCRNCDIPDLRLVAPRVFDAQRMTITAPHSDAWIATHVRVFDTFEAAVADLHVLYAFTARSRERRARFVRLDEAVDTLADAPGARVGFVFGREDSGLPNAVVERCTACVQLETSDDYPSINLAQAVLLAAHAAFVRSGDARPLPEERRESPPATAERVHRLLHMTEAHLDAIGFFRGDQRENVLATLRGIVSRADLDERDVATLLGIVRESTRAVALARSADESRSEK